MNRKYVPPTDWLRPTPGGALRWALLLNTELLLAFVYALQPGVVSSSLRYYLYPAIWLNVGFLAIAYTYPVGKSVGVELTRRRRLLAGAIAVGYFLVIAYTGGLVEPSDVATGFRIARLPPGFGPALLYGDFGIQVVLLPFKLVGYLALSYLVYATVIDAAGSAIGGALGLLSCVSCSWPVLASLLGGVFGGSVGLANAALTEPYGVSTVVFVLTVGLLAWRPFGAKT